MGVTAGNFAQSAFSVLSFSSAPRASVPVAASGSFGSRAGVGSSWGPGVFGLNLSLSSLFLVTSEIVEGVPSRLFLTGVLYDLCQGPL